MNTYVNKTHFNMVVDLDSGRITVDRGAMFETNEIVSIPGIVLVGGLQDQEEPKTSKKVEAPALDKQEPINLEKALGKYVNKRFGLK